MNFRKAIPAILMLVLLPVMAHPYILPECAISDSEMAAPAEEVFAQKKSEMDAMSLETNLARLREHLKNPKTRLSKNERAAFLRFKKLNDEMEFWNYVSGLKRDLMALTQSSSGAENEADWIAKTSIDTLYKLSKKFRVGGSALVHNFLINRGIKDGGFCYQYVDALIKELSTRTLKYYELKWGEAWAGTYRENNSLVITARSSPFEKGIAIDAWRTAGRPFWTPVKGDRFPWKEASIGELE